MTMEMEMKIFILKARFWQQDHQINQA